MHSRIFIGVTAWVLGAVTATTGSVLVVSLLSQGITGSSGQMLTQDMVNKELASEAAEASPPAAAPTVAASAEPSPTRAATTSPVAIPSSVTTSSPVVTYPVHAFAPPTSAAPTTSVAPTATSGGTVLTSQGGEVVATCQAAGAYLLSWSPQQGYEVSDVLRGPAATARVTFESTTSRVTMVVQCSAGVPSATSSTGPRDE